MMTSPLVTLLNPKGHRLILLIGLTLAILLWGFLVGSRLLPLWQASALAFGVVLVSAGVKWRADLNRLGLTATVLSVLIGLQSLHLLEHAAQIIQLYLLRWPAGRALGLISAANVEWVHFIWNWLIWGCVAWLLSRGLRNPWMWALLVWATLHNIEHSYLLVRHLQLVAELRSLGLPVFSVSHALPGILGRDGLLALTEWCGRLPGLTTAPRAVIHFWWNFGELSLLLLAAHSSGRQCLAKEQR